MPRLQSSPELKRARDAWRAMKRRCLDKGHKDYPRYGAKGISVTPRWLDFEHFLEDMGLPPSGSHWLGRKNVLGNYEPSNCLWTTHDEQVRRRAFCTKIKLNCEELTISEAARELLMDRRKLQRRLKEQGKPLEVAVLPGPMTRRNEILITHVGVTLTLKEWAKRTGTPPSLIARRMRAGWPVAQALHPRRQKGTTAFRPLNPRNTNP